MSGGKQIPDEWTKDEYIASPLFWDFYGSGKVIAPDKLGTTYRAVYPQFHDRARELEEIRRAQVDTL